MKRNLSNLLNKIAVTALSAALTYTLCICAAASPNVANIPTATVNPAQATVPTTTVAPAQATVPTTTVAPTQAAVPTAVPTANPVTVPTVPVSPAPVVSPSNIADGSANTIPYTQVTEFKAPAELINLKPSANCFIIFGDSRSCSLACTLITDKTWKKIYVSNNYPYSDIVAVKDNTMIVICAEAGGYYDNGAYNRAYSRFNRINNVTTGIANSAVHYYCNLFGVNDVMIARRNSTSDYLRMNEAIRSANRNAEVFYQFTAGPIDEVGTAELTNEEIEKFNSHYKNTKRCAIIDLYAYLADSGYKAAITAEDTTGLHYDTDTNYKILGLILSLAKAENTTSATTAAPAAAPVTVPSAAPTTAPNTTIPTIMPTVAPAAIP